MGASFRLAAGIALAALTAPCQTTREQENNPINPEVVHS